MYDKFVANGEDLTDVFCWEPTDDVVRGNYGIPATMSLYPFADKAKRVDEKFRNWGCSRSNTTALRGGLDTKCSSSGASLTANTRTARTWPSWN